MRTECEHSNSGNPDGTFTARAWHIVNGYVHGEVEDQGGSWHGELSLSATYPHGLYLLLNMASACGVKQAGRGHLVWFHLDYPLGPVPPRR